MGSLADYVRDGRKVNIVNMGNGETIVQLVLTPYTDDSLNEPYIENVCEVVEKYIGYLNKNDCNVGIHYKNFTVIGVYGSGSDVKTIRIKSTGEVLAVVKFYPTVDIFNLSLQYGVAYAVEKYYTSVKKNIDKAKKEPVRKKRSR